ncbi:general negative regulator of transcription subunit 5 [Pestalotiopsis sp. IQ-011]
MKNSSNNLSSNYGEVDRQANVLASCYIVSPSASLKGFHYCTTLAAGADPPLAAITQDNELALQPKKKRSSASSATSSGRRRGGATYQIREECERFFCETMRSVFQVEGNMASNGSCLTDVYNTPPIDYPTLPSSYPSTDGFVKPAAGVCGWMEFWDYAGGASFRAFVADDGEERSLFAFFDAGLMGRDLKKALIALMDLAENPYFDCSQVVICLDRLIPEEDAKSLMRSFQWVGFELAALDHWAKDLDVTSDKWLFMAMEV